MDNFAIQRTGISLLHWISNDEIADFIVYQIIQTHKVRYGRTDH